MTAVDLAAVQADDALLDQLGEHWRTPEDVNGELARLLAAWRWEIRADSDRALVDTDTALAVISAARPRPPRRPSAPRVIAAAVATLVLAASALGIASWSARPGDWLYPVREVLYGICGERFDIDALIRYAGDGGWRAECCS